MIIKPTIGRRVWFYPNGASALSDGKPLAIIGGPAEAPPVPCDAGIVYVWSDRMVNLDVCDHYGNHHPAASVTLVQEGDEIPAIGAYATWMPYQQGQAKAQPATGGVAS